MSDELRRIPFPNLSRLGPVWRPKLKAEQVVVERLDHFWEYVRETCGHTEGPHVGRVWISADDYSKLRAWIEEPVRQRWSKKTRDKEIGMMMLMAAPAVDEASPSGWIRVDSDAFMPPGSNPDS